MIDIKKIAIIGAGNIGSALAEGLSSTPEFQEKNIYLTRFNGKKGIVRCEHTEKEETIQLLHSISHIDKKSVTINTIATSGTIKSLIQKHDTNKELKR